MSIAGDIESGWLSLLKTYPMKRKQYITGKYVATVLAFLLVIVVAFGFVLTVGGLLGGVRLPIVLVILTLLCIIIFVSLGILLGVFAKTRLFALALSLVVWSFLLLLISYALMAIGAVVSGHLLQKLIIITIHINPVEWARFGYFIFSNQASVLGPAFYDVTRFYLSPLGQVGYGIITILWIVLPLMLATKLLKEGSGDDSVRGKNVAKVYENDRGLKEASFQAQAGRILALVGGNGAGKSTLIRLLTGQEKQQSGEIIWHQPQTIRFMPDDVNFPTMLTAAEILELLASLKQVDKYEQENVLKRVSLWDVRKQRAKHFSKGMLQRLNLAQSLLGNGSLLILDEPTNGLDPFWIAQLKNMMLEEKKKGNTVIFSTHLLSFAEEIADDVLVLHEGEIIISGAISEIFLQENSTSLEEIWLKRLNL